MSVPLEVNATLQDLIADLYALQDAVLHDEAGRQELVAAYLRENESVITLAVEAWASTDEVELRHLQSEHRELDETAYVHDFRGIATMAFRDALDPSPLNLISDDDIHMLIRVLDYAKYLVAPDADVPRLVMHPVREYLERPVQPSAVTTAMTSAARTALNLAAEVVGGRNPNIGPDALLIGCLAAAVDTRGVTAGVLEEFASALSIPPKIGVAQRLIANTQYEFGVTSEPEASEGSVEMSVLGPLLDPVLRFAHSARPSPEVRLRDLLAGALTAPDAALDGLLRGAFGRTRKWAVGVLRSVVVTRGPEDAAAWSPLLHTSPNRYEGGVSADLVDPETGIPLLKDSLGVGRYAAVLAALVADPLTPMPLSIGLFGAWGSGKSTFMGLMRGQLDELSKCDGGLRNVKQINFNAWHYSDANLWASLGDEIFEQLAPAPSDDEKETELRKELTQKISRRAELEAAYKQASDQVGRLRAEVLVAQRQKAVTAKDLLQVVTGSPEATEAVETAFKRLGINDEVAQATFLIREVRGIADDVTTVRKALRLKMATVAGVTAIFVALSVLVAWIWPAVSRWFLGGGLAAVSVALGVAAGMAERVRSATRTLARVGNEAKTRSEEEAIAPKLRALHEAESREHLAEQQIAAVGEQVAELGRELSELSPGQRMYRFLAERAASGDYAEQLGIISTIRKDLEMLTYLLERLQADGQPHQDLPDRIVLFIDDLDRCSTPQIVAVLQAVHLLLAHPLFVVVVGVDPRWLVRALRHEYSALLAPGVDASGLDPKWDNAPEDYLEKIFNIPFVLPAMATDRFEFILRDLVGEQQERKPTAPSRQRTVVNAEPGEGGPTDRLAAGSTPDPTDGEAEDEGHGTDPSGSDPSHAPPEPAVELAPLREEELTSLAKIQSLVDTPREAKRIFNLYRLLRSSFDDELGEFISEDGAQGDYRALAAVLGLVTLHGRFLRDLLSAAPVGSRRGGLLMRTEGTWSEFVADLRPRQLDSDWENSVVGVLHDGTVDEWFRLADGMGLTAACASEPGIAVYQKWAREVGEVLIRLIAAQHRFGPSNE